MIIKSIKERLAEYFFLNPTGKLRVRQIERELKMPLPSVIRYCKELEEEGIVTTTQIGNIVFYAADRTNDTFISEKRLFNIRQIQASGLIDYLRKELSNPTIVLFGSFFKGEDIENSDIDFYIETMAQKNIDVSKFEKNIKRKIHIFRYKNIRSITNPQLANNIINGIVLNGFMEVFI